MLKVAIVGCGGISRSHLNSWKQIPEAKIVGACDVRAEKYQVFVDETGCNGYLDFSAMLRREKPDIVDICLPTYLHADYAVKALKHGCHVLTEKPISLKMRDVDRVYSAARRANRRVMVAQVLRFWREYMGVCAEAVDDHVGQGAVEPQAHRLRASVIHIENGLDVAAQVKALRQGIAGRIGDGETFHAVYPVVAVVLDSRVVGHQIIMPVHAQGHGIDTVQRAIAAIGLAASGLPSQGQAQQKRRDLCKESGYYR